jgi:hypothetical protein
MKTHTFKLFAIFFIALGFTSIGQAASTPSSTATSNVNVQVTTADYVDFLNEVAQSDPGNLYTSAMEEDPSVAAIFREGEPGSYCYSYVEGEENNPVAYIDNASALRYCEWLQESGYQVVDYKIEDASANGEDLRSSSSVFSVTLDSGAPSLSMLPVAAVAGKVAADIIVEEVAPVALAAGAALLREGRAPATELAKNTAHQIGDRIKQEASDWVAEKTENALDRAFGNDSEEESGKKSPTPSTSREVALPATEGTRYGSGSSLPSEHGLKNPHQREVALPPASDDHRPRTGTEGSSSSGDNTSKDGLAGSPSSEESYLKAASTDVITAPRKNSGDWFKEQQALERFK